MSGPHSEDVKEISRAATRLSAIDAKNETAYPSTFVLDSSRKVLFAQVSKTHGGRAKVNDVLKTLAVK